MSVGSPRPRLTYQPSGMSRARRAAISSRLSGFSAGAVALMMSLLSSRRRVGAVDLNDAVHEDARCHDGFRNKLAELNEVARLHDGELGRHRHHRIEVPSRAAIGEIAPAISLPRLDERNVGMKRALHQIRAAAEFARLFALAELRADGGRRVEGGDPGGGRADTLGDGSLRHDLELDLAFLEHLFELGRRRARETADQFRDAACGKELRQHHRASARVVRHEGEVARALKEQAFEEFLRLTDDAEAAQKDYGAVLDAV